MTPSRGTQLVKRTEVRIEACFVDLSMSDLVDPNLRHAGYIGGSSPMAMYVDSGRVYRMMPTGWRRHRDRCRTVVQAYVKQLDRQAVEQADRLAQRVAEVDPKAVAALRGAGLSDAAVAKALGLPEGALASFKG
jgi:hypothetical protein